MMAFGLIDESLTIINSNKLADVMDLLVDRGFRTDKLIFPEDYSLIRKLIKNGATTKHFYLACEVAVQLMDGQENFSINYLAVIVESMLQVELMKSQYFMPSH